MSFELVAAERHALADLCEGLTPEQWAWPSLCEGWAVRDVVGHLLAGPTTGLGEFALLMVRARFRFDVANHRLGLRRGQMPTARLVALLREHAEHRFTPPGFDWHAPLADLLLHRDDVVLPLGLPSDRPPEAWRHALDLLVTPKARASFGPRGLPAVRLVADDVGWEHGAGPDVTGAAGAIALALAGRAARLGELTGPGMQVLRAWLGQ